MIKLIKKHCKSKTISLHGDPYLTRYYIFVLCIPFFKDKDKRPIELFGLYLHQFHRADNDRDLHNHPWLFAASWILKGFYVEERLNRSLTSVSRHKNTINFLPGSAFHRIKTIEPGLHTLFFRGPRSKQWGFLRARNKQVIFEPYEEN